MSRLKEPTTSLNVNMTDRSSEVVNLNEEIHNSTRTEPDRVRGLHRRHRSILNNDHFIQEIGRFTDTVCRAEPERVRGVHRRDRFRLNNPQPA